MDKNQEPTHRQHKILVAILEEGRHFKKDSDDDMEQYWELTRAHYLQNLICFSGSYDWKFILTEQGEQYLASFKHNKIKK